MPALSNRADAKSTPTLRNIFLRIFVFIRCLSVSPPCCFCDSEGLEEAKNLAGKSPPPDSDPFSGAKLGKNLGCWSIGL
jgi:hypothetical protein